MDMFQEDQMLNPLQTQLFENEDGLYEDDEGNLFVLLDEAVGRVGRLGKPRRKTIPQSKIPGGAPMISRIVRGGAGDRPSRVLRTAS